MTASTIQIEQLERVTAEGTVERLQFQPGLNILVGRPNTGKTIWLTMLDYALGDRSSVERALPIELTQKYSIVRAILRTDTDVQIVVERRWKEPGAKHKVFIDDYPLSVVEFSSYFLSKLGIPVLHYPQGDPYSARTWPELSWRSLFRHIFRRQDIGWGGIVERQPEGEQHACMLQFLGIAESIYSNDYAKLVDLRKTRTSLEARRENFLITLNEISRDLLEMDAPTGLTPATIDESLLSIASAVDDLQKRKNVLSEAILNRTSRQSAAFLRQKAHERAECINLQSKILQERREAEQRLRAITEYINKVDDERIRLERANKSGELFSHLRITNCPACDQPIRGSNDGATNCFLCKRTLSPVTNDVEMARERISVGLLHLREEARESRQLKDDLELHVHDLTRRLRIADEKLLDLQSDIDRSRQPASVVFSEEVSQIDVEIGRLEERRKQCLRIADAFRERENITKRILDLEQEISDLDDAVNKRSVTVDFTSASDALADGMNDYLNLLNRFRANAWSQREVTVSLRERQFRFSVGGESWATRLGGTLTLYFLLAYQYSLLKLSNNTSYNYPGLALLDMPAELPDIEISDLENFAIEPFAVLLTSDSMRHCQAIVAGSSFQNLSGAHKIELTHVFS